MFAISVFGLGAAIFVLLRPTSGGIAYMHFDLAGFVLPFTLWFLGSELKRNSDSARKVTLAAMIYLSIVGVVALTVMAVSGMTEHWLPTMKLEAYGMCALGMIVSILCIYGLRKRNIG